MLHLLDSYRQKTDGVSSTQTNVPILTSRQQGSLAHLFVIAAGQMLSQFIESILDLGPSFLFRLNMDLAAEFGITNTLPITQSIGEWSKQSSYESLTHPSCSPDRQHQSRHPSHSWYRVAVSSYVCCWPVWSLYPESVVHWCGLVETAVCACSV